MKKILILSICFMLSFLYYKLNAQDIVVTNIEPNITKVEIAKNLILNIKGKYPSNYKPIWNCVWNPRGIEYNLENNVVKHPIIKTEKIITNLESSDNKATVFFDGCICDIKLPTQIVTINERPQTFELVNFRSIKNGLVEPCKQKNPFFKGGWEGKVTLSSNDSGDINMNLIISGFGDSRFKGRYLSYGWSLQNYVLQNQMTPKKALTVLTKKRNDRISDSLDDVARQKVISENYRLFELSIKNSFSKVADIQMKFADKFNMKCLKIVNESYTISGHSEPYSVQLFDRLGPIGYETRYRWVSPRDVIREGFKNTCTNTIYIKGIKKLVSYAGTVYYEDASIELKQNQMTGGVLNIEENYNPKTAEIGSIHYYKNKLKAILH